MALNKSNGNMYGFVTHTWNPLGGECQHKCHYCYVNAMKDRYELVKTKYSGDPRVWEPEMKTNLGRGNKIFVCDMTDLFAANVKEDDILRILRYCNQSHESNEFLFQTKNPERIVKSDAIKQYLSERESTIIASTLTTDATRDSSGVMRMTWMGYIAGQLPNNRVMITMEPLMKFRLQSILTYLGWVKRIYQINIGADSKNSGLPEPTSEEIHELINALREHGYNVHIKDNLKRLL